MVKSLFKSRRLEKKMQPGWLVSRLSPKAKDADQPTRPTVESQPPRSVHPPIHTTEMQVEGFNDPSKPDADNLSQSDQAVQSSSVAKPVRAKASAQVSEWMQKPWSWSLIWLAALGVLGGMGTAAMLWLVTLPPQIDCRDTSKLSLDMERLYCAQEAAQSGEIAKLIAGIDMLKQWQPDHPLYREAQRLIEDWSGQVLTIATRRVERGDLKGAEAAISHLPQTTPVYAEAHKSLARWRKYSKTASGIYAKAQSAMKQKDWKTVSEQIVFLAEFERDYWQLEKGADAVAQQLGVEKQAWQVLTRAQKIAATGDPDQIGAAIPVAQEVPAQTYAAQTAKANLKQWSQKLVSLSTQKWQKGDQAGTVALLKQTAKVANTPETEDLFKFGNAYMLANTALSEQWIPSMGGILNLMEAIAAVEQVKSTSPFYSQAQTLKKNWQAQLQDAIQIKYAGLTASLGQQSTLELAIGQAKQIAPDQPGRIQAQSLIAHWRAEVERLEDQPIMDQAVRIAKAGTIDALKQAIAQAKQIDLGRSLRGQAQTLIATWRSQIQVLEDRPKLDEAWLLARQNKLGEAIEVASVIQPGRALYREAQNTISDWRYQQTVDAQIAQDQPILDRANALAENGDLAAAIDAASQIGTGRALYSRAQSSIERWEDQLNPPPPEPDNFSRSGFDTYIPEDELFPNSNNTVEPTPSPGVHTFPSPDRQLEGFPSPLQLAPPPRATYEPFPEPTVVPEPPAPNQAPRQPAEMSQPIEEPVPPDPLPPRSPDPLPPSP